MSDNMNLRLASLTQVILGAQSGNLKCKVELYERFKPMIRKMARSVNKNDREDAQQELIYELFLAAQRFRIIQNSEAYKNKA